jgi:hypothetical protein
MNKITTVEVIDGAFNFDIEINCNKAYNVMLFIANETESKRFFTNNCKVEKPEHIQFFIGIVFGMACQSLNLQVFEINGYLRIVEVE